jgi:flagellar biosynthesis protein
MVSLLMQVDLDARIPPELYQAVAELLAWLYRLESGVVDEEGAAETESSAAPPSSDETPLTPGLHYPLLPR